MNLTFYGVRGSTPTHGSEYLKYGGNSSSLFVRAKDGSPYLFDAGSGIRNAGNDLLRNAAETNIKKVKLFLSHHHWDHILGFPFFAPIYTKGWDISVYSGAKEMFRKTRVQEKRVQENNPDDRLRSNPVNDYITDYVNDSAKRNKDSKCIDSELKKVFEGQFDRHEGYFPVSLDDLAAVVSFHDLHQGEKVNSPLTVYHFLHDAHPGGMSSYRVEESGKSFVYTGDYESDFQRCNAQFGVIDKRLISFAKEVDVLVMDGQYTLAEYEQKKGFGHSPYTKVCEIAAAAKVKKLIITHHDPSHTDDVLDAMEFDARNYMSFILGKDISVVFAKEGMNLEI